MEFVLLLLAGLLSFRFLSLAEGQSDLTHMLSVTTYAYHFHLVVICLLNMSIVNNNDITCL